MKNLFFWKKTDEKAKKKFTKIMKKRQRTKCMKKVFPFFIVHSFYVFRFLLVCFILKNDNIVFNRTFATKERGK